MINFVVLMEKNGIARYYRRLDKNEILFEIYKDGNLEVSHRIDTKFLAPEILFSLFLAPKSIIFLKDEKEKS